MKERLARIAWIAHLGRAWTRYNRRLGGQFAAAATYFSALAIVPLLMVAAAGVGLTTSVLRPDLGEALQRELTRTLGNGPGTGKLTDFVDNILQHWVSIGIVGLGTALYSGASWVGNLRSALRAMQRSDIGVEEQKKTIVLETLVNMAVLAGIGVLIAVITVAASAGTALNGWLATLFRATGQPWFGIVAWVISSVVASAASWLLFLYIYSVLPEARPRPRTLLRGAALAALFMVVLQNVGGIAIRLMARNPAAAVFGPIIVLMLLFNIFAQFTLFIASWIATEPTPAADVGSAPDGSADPPA